MNLDNIFGGLTSITDWIETFLINGFLGNGFRVIMGGFNLYTAFKPVIDIFVAIFGLFGAA